ncbi:GNAT family N-acetyltransferase, partial [Streptomyces sp. SID10362]|uniref:GNAT family N-acetyltransferase n=2 Tax=unclassified Streptomyces TaxID=2593676 RepID=UPI0013C759C1
ERLYACWRGPRRRLADSLCLELPALPLDELAARLPSAKARQRVRAQLRRLDALGVKSRPVLPGEAEAAVRRLLELHRLQWRGRKVTGEHLRPRFREHLVRAVGPMVRSGDAVVTEFRMADEVVAVDVTLLSRRLAGGYLYGAHPRLREAKADVAVMLLDACAGYARAPGRSTLSLLRGDEPYKHRWRPAPVPNQRLLLARRRTAPLLAAALCDAAARRRGKELLRWNAERRGSDGDGTT